MIFKTIMICNRTGDTAWDAICHRMVRDFSGYNGTGADYTAGTNFGAGKNRNVSRNPAVVPNRYAADIQYGKIRIDIETLPEAGMNPIVKINGSL